MTKRICNRCGKHADVRYGELCEKGHFVCGRHDHDSYCLICSSKDFKRASGFLATGSDYSWRDELAHYLPAHLEARSLLDPSEVRPAGERSFLAKLISHFDVRPGHIIPSRGATLDRVMRALTRADYHPKAPQMREHTVWIDCSLKADGLGPFHIILFSDPEHSDKYWGCRRIGKLTLKLTAPQLDRMNFEYLGLCFHNHFDSTCIEAFLFLEAMTDEAIERSLHYFMVESVWAMNDIIDMQPS